MKAILRPWLPALAAAAISLACGSKGSKGTSNQGAGATGGTGATHGGSGGTTGAGGSTGSGGSGGAGQAADAGPDAPVAGNCPNPTDPTKAALCVSFNPEKLNLIGDPQLDGKGVLLVSVFDRDPTVPPGAAPVKALQDQVYPPQAAGADASAGAQADIGALPTLKFDGLPDTVYVQTVFLDNPIAIATGTPLIWGTWLGGVDTTARKDLAQLPLEAVKLTVGKGTSVTQDLKALRYLNLSISLKAGVTPLDDGQGPLIVFAFDSPTPGNRVLTGGGLGRAPSGQACVNVGGGAIATAGVYLLGVGPHYLVAKLDDYNLGGDPTPGSLLSPSAGDASLTIDESAKITFGPSDYAAAANFELSRVLPVGSPAPAPYPCP